VIIEPMFVLSAGLWIFNYNQSWAQAIVVGRDFRVGPRIVF